MMQHQDLTTQINGEVVSRSAVLAWEARRARKVLKQLGDSVPPSTDVDELRDRLLGVKERIGQAALERRLRGKLRSSGLFSRLLVTVPGSARTYSSIKVRSPRGRAEEFAAWFKDQSALAYSRAMLAACPDHYFIGEDAQGRQKVIETTGGSPLPTMFLIDYRDISSLRITAGTEYPVQIAGIARDESGTPIGGVRHQFRNLDNGFEAWLTVEFPHLTPSRMIRQHRWHLACEFGNWIEFADADQTQE